MVWRTFVAALVTAVLTTAGSSAARPLACGVRDLGAVEAPGPVTPNPVPSAADPYEAAQLGIDWLMLEMCTWMQTTGQGQDCATETRGSCMGCHVQAETVLGLARSSKRCYRLPTTTCSQPGDESPLEFAARFTAGAQRKDCILGPFNTGCGYIPADPGTRDGYPQELGSIGHYADCGANTPPASVHPIIQSAHGGLSLAGYTSYVSPRYSGNLLALSNWFVTRQDPFGKWIPDRNEAPVDQGELFVTGAAIRALVDTRPYASPAEAMLHDDATGRAVNWVRTAPRSTNQDKAWSLLAFSAVRLFPGDPDRDAVLADLVDDQNADGGWSERAGLLSNAYATGQALYALLEAGESIEAPEVCSGIRWLVDRQNADGSWSLGVPGSETDSSRNSFFTATIWPVLALGSLRPWGASITVPDADIESCRDTETFTLTIAHAADSACGLFARPDVYDLTVYNALGDIATVDPPQLTLAAGESASATVTWTRAGPQRPAGTVSLNVLKLTSQGAAAAGCPVVVGSTLTVTVPPDDVPGALGFGLRVARAGGDVALTWPAHPETIGGYELVGMSCPDRMTCATDPVRGLLDASTPRLVMPPSQLQASLPGEALAGADRLMFYKVRAFSPCEGLAGPTCNFACADPRACWAGCR